MKYNLILKIGKLIVTTIKNIHTHLKHKKCDKIPYKGNLISKLILILQLNGIPDNTA